jgi:hypothetical protein
VLGEALTVAIVVTYARPFTQKYNRFGEEESFDTSFLVDPLPNQQRGLHNYMVRERHQAFAHSDASLQRIKVADTSAERLITSHGIPVLLEKSEAEKLLANVCQMKALMKLSLEELSAVIGPYEFVEETNMRAAKPRRTKHAKTKR